MGGGPDCAGGRRRRPAERGGLRGNRGATGDSTGRPSSRSQPTAEPLTGQAPTTQATPVRRVARVVIDTVSSCSGGVRERQRRGEPGHGGRQRRRRGEA